MVSRIALAVSLALSILAVPAPAQSQDNLPMMDQAMWAAFKARDEAAKQEVAAKLEKAVVWVLCMKNGEVQSSGSGFVVADGHILTNSHVSMAPPGRSYDGYLIVNHTIPFTKAEVVAEEDHNLSRDYALLKFTPPAGVQLPVLSFNTEVKRLENVYAWGYPGLVWMGDVRRLNLADNASTPSVSVTEGTVNTVIMRRSNQQAIIHTAETSSGNSGGPLVNEFGEVVGINTFTLADDRVPKSTNAALAAKHVVDFMRRHGAQPLLSERTQGGSEWWRPEAGAATTERDLSLLDRDELTALAEQNNAEAQFILGHRFYSDLEEYEDDDDAEAEKWLKASMDQGNIDAAAFYGLTLLERRDEHAKEGLNYLLHAAQAALVNQANPWYVTVLGKILYQSESYHIPFDRVATVVWGTLAGEKGDAAGKALQAAQIFVGLDGFENVDRAAGMARDIMSEWDDPDARALVAWEMHLQDNHKEARVQAQLAAEDGSSLGQALMARMHRTGVGAPQDWEAALDYAEQSQAKADPLGLAELALYHATPDGEGSRDLVSAWVSMYYAAAKLNNPNFVAMLQSIESEMDEGQIRRARAMAERWLTHWGGREYDPDYMEPLRETAEAGDAEAQFKMGEVHGWGYGVEASSEANNWYRKAAEQGHVAAMFRMGMNCRDGAWMTTPDPGQAIMWFERSASAGHSWSKLELAKMHLNGTGAPRDVDKALELAGDAANDGLADAMHFIAEIYAPVNDIRPDRDEALVWHRKAAELGNADSALIIGMVTLMKGNVDEGVKWLWRAVDGGSIAAGKHLGYLYFKGESESGGGVPKDERLGIRLTLQAAERGDAEAQQLMARIYINGAEGVDVDEVRAVEWLRLSAAQGNAVSQTDLGLMYAMGKGVAQDFDEAAKWHRRAAEAGNPAGQFFLALAYYDGLGVPVDRDEARKWMEKAAAGGHRQAEGALAAWIGTAPQSSQGAPQSAAPGSEGPEADDMEQRLASLRKLAEDGDVEAMWRLSLELFDTQDSAHAAEMVKWARMAASHGNHVGQTLLGTAYYFGFGVEESDKEAEKWFRWAADQGNVRAMARLADLYWNGGVGVPPDYAEAAKWAALAAEDGEPLAMMILGRAYKYGQGVEKNTEEARKWLNRAAEQGLERAKEELADM